MTSAIDTPDWVTLASGPTKQLFSGAGGVGALPVAGYQSLIVQLGNDDAATFCVARYRFHDASGNIIDSGLLSADTTISGATWILPVVGATFDLVSGVGVHLTATVTGTPLNSGKRMLGDWIPLRKFQATVPNGTPSSTLTPLPGLSVSSDAEFPDLSSYNGQVFYAYSISAVAGSTLWRLEAGGRRLDGSAYSELLIGATVVGTINLQAGHPFAFTSWGVRNVGATTAANTVTLTIVPAEAT